MEISPWNCLYYTSWNSKGENPWKILNILPCLIKIYRMRPVSLCCTADCMHTLSLCHTGDCVNTVSLCNTADCMHTVSLCHNVDCMHTVSLCHTADCILSVCVTLLTVCILPHESFLFSPLCLAN